MTLKEYNRAQVQEACGPENKWYCSQHFGKEIKDEPTLMKYYIKHGGTEHFAQAHQRELAACVCGSGNCGR